MRIRRQLAAARPDAFLPYLATSLNNLGTMLSELGRREEALAQAEEAVGIYRQLTAARPDAFLQDLAMSLGANARCLSGLGRAEEAVPVLHQAIHGLSPMFLRHPQALSRLMLALTADYLEALKSARQEPDLLLLAPVLETLRTLAGQK